MPSRGVVAHGEWRWVIAFSAAVMLIMLLPYLAAWAHQGGDWQFGGFLFGVDDGYSYLTVMRRGATGAWLFTDRYTSEAHAGAAVYMPYLLLGKAAALFVGPDDPNLTIALAVAYHAARTVLGFALLLVSYRFAALFLPGVRSRRLALALIALGGGLGWLLALLGREEWLGSLPVDFIVPEGYSFLILFGLPHLALARIALLGGFLLLFRALDESAQWARWSALAGLSWTVTGLGVPFFIPLIYLVLGVWGLAAWARTRRFPWILFWRAVVAAAVTLPLLLYTAAAFAGNDVLRQWSAQNRLPSPHPLHYLLGYGVLAVPAVPGLRWAWRRGQLPGVLLVAWVVTAPLAVYLPILVQRRLAEGVIVPLSILAAAGLGLAFPHARPWRRARAAVLTLALPTALLLWLGALLSALNPARPTFQPTAELTALNRINAALPAGSVVLSLMETGNVLPAYTNLIAYVGHGPETIDSARKQAEARAFFAGTLRDHERAALLREVDYVLAGPLERRVAAGSAAWERGLQVLPLLSPDSPIQVYEVPRE